MRYANVLLLLFILFIAPLSGCEKDQEAEKVTVAGGPGSGGSGGGGGGGGGGGNVGPHDPNDIDINSEPIWSCDGDGTDYVMYDSTSWHSTLLTTAGSDACLSQFGLGDMPYLAQVQAYGINYSGPDATQAELEAFFAVGPRSFAGLSMSSGIMISMAPNDTGSPVYQTNLATQPGTSFFTITDVEPYPFGPQAGVKVRAIWQCTMKSTGGDELECVDGIFVGYFTGDAM